MGRYNGMNPTNNISRIREHGELSRADALAELKKWDLLKEE